MPEAKTILLRCGRAREEVGLSARDCVFGEICEEGVGGVDVGAGSSSRSRFCVGGVGAVRGRWS